MWSWIESVVSGETRGSAAAVFRWGLWPASCAYRGVIAARRTAYDLGMLRSERVDAPVISVGNVTTGGTGKTPFVEWLARRLLALGRRPAIVSRGYGAGRDAVNDEHRVLAENVPDVPHVTDARRARGARVAIDKHRADCIILDDGFQHLAIQRDLDIVLLDASRPFGNGSMLPGGSLREPVGQLARSDAIVLTRVDAVDPVAVRSLEDRVHTITHHARLAQSVHQPTALESLTGEATREPGWLAGRRVYWFCAIGNPRAFAATLEQQGAAIAGGRAFRDHHRYCDQDIESVSADAAACGAEAIVTTQKDRVKLTALARWPLPAYALRVEIRIVAGERGLDEALADAISGPDRGAR